MSAQSKRSKIEIEPVMTIIKDDGTHDHRLVLKGNALIEARYSLSLTAQKLFLAMVARVNPTAKSLPGFTLTRDDLVKMDIGVGKTSAYRNFSDACVELLGLRVSVVERNLKTGEIDETDLNVFSRNTRTWKDKNRTALKKAYFRFTADVEPYLRDFSRDIHYTKFLYRYVRDLQTSHAIRIYELLRRWRSLKEVKPVISRNVSLEDLREMLGIEPSKYPNYGNFKQRILETAQKQICDATDIRFEFTGLTGGKGRKIVSVKFDIYDNKKVEPKVVEEDITGFVIPGNLEIDKGVKDKILALFPKEVGIGNEQTLYDLFEAFDIPVLKESISDFMFTSISGQIKGDFYKYFLGICKNKQREYSAILSLEKEDKAKREGTHSRDSEKYDIDDLMAELEDG